jgi:Tol biopolymer transport system component
VWSPDSKWIVVGSVSGQHSVLYRVSVETGESTQITFPEEALGDVSPSISPDGKKLVFMRHPTFNWGYLYQVDVDGDMQPVGTPHQIPSGSRWLGSAQWTADGKEIIAATPAGAIRMPASGSDDPQLIPWLSNYTGWVDISRRGDRMAYSLVAGDTNVWRIDLTSKVLHPELLLASTARDVFPQYSPDGRKLAFHSSRSGGGSQLWMSDSEGNQARQLTFNKRGLTGTPHWSPDGGTIAFDSSTTGQFQVYTISSDGGKAKQLTNGSFANFAPTWSRDGRWLYFTSSSTGRNEIWKMPSGGGTAVQVTRNGGTMGIESADGKTLFFCRDGGIGSIWKMPTGGGPEEQLTNSLYRTNFAVAKSGIYYMAAAGENGTTSLWFYSFSTGAATMVLPIGLPEYGLDVSPDGRYLVYDQLDDPASDLMLVENFH